MVDMTVDMVEQHWTEQPTQMWAAMFSNTMHLYPDCWRLRRASIVCRVHGKPDNKRICGDCLRRTTQEALKVGAP